MMDFGFGLMRLPIKSEDYADIDYEQVNDMVDKYIEAGYNYFDTGYGYHEGQSDRGRDIPNRKYRRDISGGY